MNEKEALKRARILIRRGRYKKKTVKSVPKRFVTVDSIDVIRLDGSEWIPYYDEERNQIVYGYYEKRNGGYVFHYLSFLAFDYHYAVKNPFDWVDASTYGFEDLD
ncbi:MAG: hypothetical protein ACOC14_02420 [Bacillota bacterium]